MRIRREFACIQLFAVLSLVYCDVEKDDIYFSDTSNSMDADPFSFYSDELSEDTKLSIVQTRTCLPARTQQTQEEAFYKRLVTLLMSNIVMDNNGDIITGTIRIQASLPQLETLQTFGNGKASLREIDSILSEIIQKPEGIKHSWFTVFLNIVQLTFRFVQQHQEVCLSILLLIISFIIMRNIRWTPSMALLIFIIVVFIVSFFMTWWQLIQDAQIKFTAAQMKMVEMPKTCQPHKMNLWDKFVAMISSKDDCEKYYEAMMSNPKLKVTPALVLSHLVTTVLLHPLSIFGHSLSEFIQQATDKLSWTYRWLIELILFVPIAIAVGTAIILLPLYVASGSINVGLGPLFRFKISGRRSRAENMIQDGEERKPIEVVHKVIFESCKEGIPDVLRINQSNPVLSAVTDSSTKQEKNESDKKHSCEKRCLASDHIEHSAGDTAANKLPSNSTQEEIEKPDKCKNEETRHAGGDS